MSTRLTPIDAFYAMTKVIDATWFFVGKVDRQQLATSLQTLTQRYPALASRVVRTSPLSAFGRALNKSSPLCDVELQHVSTGIHLSHASIPGQSAAEASACAHQHRGKDIYIPTPLAAEIANGKRGVMEVKLTHFEHGGSALGVAISHGVVDAKGFHLIVGELAQCYRSGGTGLLDSSSMQFGSPRQYLETARNCWDLETRNAEWEQDFYEKDFEDESIDITGIKGELLFWFLRRMAAPSMHARNSRASVVFSNEETTFSTATAIQKVVQHLPSHLYPTGDVHLCATIDLRREPSIPNLYTGNAVYFASKTTSIFEIGTTFARLRKEPSEHLLAACKKYLDCLKKGRLMSPNKMIAGFPQLCVNSQLRVIDASDLARHNLFDAGACLRVLPGHSDHLQVVPSMLDEKSVEILVNVNSLQKNWIERLESMETV